VQGEQAGGASGDERGNELVEALELAVEEFGAPAQLAQRDAGGGADDVAGPGRSDARPLTRPAAVCRANRARRSSGPVRTSALAWLIV
jgi:hypothetical protein